MRLNKNKQGFVLALTMLVLLAISSFSVAMLAITQLNSASSVKSHQVHTVQQAAEYGGIPQVEKQPPINNNNNGYPQIKEAKAAILSSINFI